MKWYTKSKRKNSKKFILINCARCGKEKELEYKDYVYAQKRNYKLYCNNHCSGKDHYQRIEPFSGWKLCQNKSEEEKHRRKPDTDMKALLKRAERRGSESNIDLNYLKELWSKQKGCCAYTGVELHHKINDPIRTASIDRIDSSKGYVKGNVQFVSVIANFAKNSYSDLLMKEWIGIIKKS